VAFSTCSKAATARQQQALTRLVAETAALSTPCTIASALRSAVIRALTRSAV
jgi:hypothetical protein